MNANQEPNPEHQEHHEFHKEEIAASSRAGTRWVRRSVITFLLIVVLVPPSAAFYSYFSGVPLHLLAATEREEEKEAAALASAPPSTWLVPGKTHSVGVSEEVAESLGIKTGDLESVAEAHTPTSTRPLELFGSMRLDPTRLARIKARFAPARVVEIAQIHDFSHGVGQSEFRELRQGDLVKKGDLLAVFYSVDVQNTKNDLLDALVQLELDQRILDRVEEHRDSVPEVFYFQQVRAMKGDRNNVNRAITTLRLWDIPQDEIDALHDLAKKISAGKSEWLKTSEGKWVRGESQEGADEKNDTGVEHDNPMGRVTLRAPFDAVIIERNLTEDEMVVDNTVNLFQVADVSRLQVLANCHEDLLPILQSLPRNQRRWTVRTAGVEQSTGLPGMIDQIQYVIDQNMHTAVVTGYVENPGARLIGGQYVSATVDIPPPEGVVEIPTDALVDDGRQSLVFVQPKPAARQFTMRRVEVTQRFEHSVFVRSSPIPEQEQLTAKEAEDHLLPKEPLLPGERVLRAGAVELKAAILDLESGHRHGATAAGKEQTGVGTHDS